LACGAVLYLVRHVETEPIPNGSTTVSVIAFGGAVVAMGLSGLVPLIAFGFPILASAAIWFGAESKGVFTLPPIAALGRWSYSIYLIHIPTLLAANALLGAHTVDGHVAIKLMLVVLILIMSGVCYRFVEAPMMVLGESMVRGSAPA